MAPSWTGHCIAQDRASIPTKHVRKNRQNLRMVPVPTDQYQRTQTVKMKDQEPVIKMVTPIEQATEMAMTELKRELEALQRKT